MFRKKVGILFVLLGITFSSSAQKIIEYVAGMGGKSKENSEVWILRRGVRATHEGMVLTSDSAHFNVKENSFEAFGNVCVEVSDTTFIWGDYLVYDGIDRVANIWADTVIMIDGKTTLISDHFTYDRNGSKAYYIDWGVAANEHNRLSSQNGVYDVENKVFYIWDNVELSDTSSVLVTDSLTYSTRNKLACFFGETVIYTTETQMYSMYGEYNTETRLVRSYRSSRIVNKKGLLEGDTIYYLEQSKWGMAKGNVLIVDSINHIVCTGKYGESDQERKLSFVTDSAMVMFIEDEDSLFVHADTLNIGLDSIDNIKFIKANYHVQAYRKDLQARCDSAYYVAEDSVLSMYGEPIVWYEHYQGTADTIAIHHDTSGIDKVYFKTNTFAVQQIDREKFSQIKGIQGVIFVDKSRPKQANITGNSKMVYYILDEDQGGNTSVVGANIGDGDEIKIYFDSTSRPVRVVTMNNPDMQTYPVNGIPVDMKLLEGFLWRSNVRPREVKDIFEW